MSFDLICSNCGATSGPSVGICPFCKNILTSAGEKESTTLKSFRKAFQDGRLDAALAVGKDLERAKPQLRKDQAFALLYAQVLIEAEAPSSQVKALLMEALLEGEHPVLQEYLEVIEAKGMLSHEKEDAGEVMLKGILRRSPQNAHANFLLGSHLFWVEKDPPKAAKYLEAAVRERPTFMRAVACLGALYQTLGNGALAERSFRKCRDLESNPVLKKYFSDLMVKAAGK